MILTDDSCFHFPFYSSTWSLLSFTLFQCHIYISKSQLIIFIISIYGAQTVGYDYAQPWAYNSIQENPQILALWSLKSSLPVAILMLPPPEGLTWFLSLVYMLTVFHPHCTFGLYHFPLCMAIMYIFHLPCPFIHFLIPTAPHPIPCK